MQIIENYAPIIIPTLNRKNHLQRCIRSLSENTGAEYTDLYISVDYPPSEKYFCGYNEVVEYLKTADELNRFKNVFIYYQEANLGACGNTDFLKRKVKELSDEYIYSEDDNEFSVNFLEYINKGLSRYKNDNRVISVNAMKDTDWIFPKDNNVIAMKLYPAYGCGSWFSKEEQIESELHELLLSRQTVRPKSVYKLYKYNRFMFSMFVSGIIGTDTGLFYRNNRIRLCDTTLSFYMFFTDKFCVVPTVSKSRTWGNDGSGLNMKSNPNINPETRWILDKNVEFEYRDAGLEYNTVNDKIGENFLIENLGKPLTIIHIIEYLLFLVLGYNKSALIKIKNFGKKVLCHSTLEDNDAVKY